MANPHLAAFDQKQRSARRSHIDEVNERLDSHAQAGTLTYDILWDAIVAVDSGSAGCIPESIGMNWIETNHDLFLGAVGNFTFFVMRTREEQQSADKNNPRRHLSFWFFQRMLVRPRLVKLFGDEERELFVTKLYSEYGAINNGWVDVALELGVGEEAIGEAVVARLRNSEYKRGTAGDIGDFLEYGVELVGNNPRAHILSTRCVWAHLSKAQLEAALRICASKHPNGLLAWKPWTAMRIALGDGIAAQIVRDAVARLSSIAGVSQEILDSLNDKSKRALAKRIDLNEYMNDEVRWATVNFLVSLRDPKNEYSLRDLFITLTTHERAKIGPDLIYRVVRKMYGLNSKAEQVARTFLLQRGWGCGKVEEEIFQHKAKGQTRQFVVWYDGGKFVQGRDHDHTSHRYYPTPEDHVIFRIEGAHWLVENHVCLVRFVDVTDRPPK